MGGAIDQSTKLTDVGSNEIRSAASYDGSAFWMNGTGSAQTVRYATLGASTSRRVATSSSGLGTRSVNIFKDAAGDAQLYFSSSNRKTVSSLSKATDPIPKLPDGSSGTAAYADLFANAGASPYDFLLIDGNTMYVTDDDNSAIGGIQKWTSDGTTWTKQYVLQAGLSYVPLRGLTGYKDAAGNVVLIATDGNGQYLVTTTDLGATSTFTTIASATGNLRFHDVVLPYLVPEPATASLLGLAGLCLLRRRRCSAP
jgi:hypothetical protein